MDDRNAARQIAAIFGRSCHEPSNDQGPALDSAAEVVASVRAEARVEALREAADRAVFYMDQYRHGLIEFSYQDMVKDIMSDGPVKSAILADEPKEREAKRKLKEAER